MRLNVVAWSVASLLIGGCGGEDPPPPAAAAASAPPSASPTSEPSSTVGADAPRPTALGPMVDAKTCGNFGWGNIGPARIAGVDYPESLPVACFNSAEVASADFLVPATALSLTAAVGIEDHTKNTDAKATFSVLNAVTGKPLSEAVTVAYGQPASPFTVPVAGATRIRLQTRFTQTRPGLITACWATPTFVS
ncbi:NPCBM/NEW2 domain-containing protein [Amorphoplanes digitatis]|uniref:Glycosyl hydrolase family 98 putative carbohydrate-binding module domain-containing protein n=1 Tax=Actinoplanes digitatis TaxID=1868 RepID=A0A7W7HYJ1_9ACTN|nr:NPCBM/NEW2 domain-containing protein [Actinoplanes digitatis]MBB4763135.1 hypothetical protein [Actinoplanes digitatis]